MEELGDNPEIRHITLCWDGTTGEVSSRGELVRAGFVVEVQQVMIARAAAVPTPTLDPSLELRALDPSDLSSVCELAYAIGDRHDEAHRQFLQRRSAWHQRLVDQGRARFWGVFERSSLVGSLGLVVLAPPGSDLATAPLDHIGRYQDVQTAPSHRRRGIAGALLGTAAAWGSQHAIDTVVIVAIPDSAAARVYQRLGFRTIEHTSSACRVPEADHHHGGGTPTTSLALSRPARRSRR